MSDQSPEVPARPNPPHDIYLGYGVYASWDGFQIWLALNDHRRKVIALEPAVFKNLVDYAKKFYGEEK